MGLRIVPVTRDEANKFIERLHRHHGRVLGARFYLGVALDGVLVGVAAVGRPVSRMLDDGMTLEVTRTCTDGTKNVNSMLYGAAWRAAKAIGYRRLVTYTLPEESGISVVAAGFECTGVAGGGSWSRVSRPRFDSHPIGKKIRWVKS